MKQTRKKTSVDLSLMVEDQRRLLQSLNDIRFMLSNPYTKEYFLRAIVRRADLKAAKGTELSVSTVARFLRVIISKVVTGCKSDEEGSADQQPGGASLVVFPNGHDFGGVKKLVAVKKAVRYITGMEVTAATRGRNGRCVKVLQ